MLNRKEIVDHIIDRFHYPIDISTPLLHNHYDLTRHVIDKYPNLINFSLSEEQVIDIAKNKHNWLVDVILEKEPEYREYVYFGSLAGRNEKYFYLYNIYDFKPTTIDKYLIEGGYYKEAEKLDIPRKYLFVFFCEYNIVDMARKYLDREQIINAITYSIINNHNLTIYNEFKDVLFEKLKYGVKYVNILLELLTLLAMYGFMDEVKDILYVTGPLNSNYKSRLIKLLQATHRDDIIAML